MNRIDPSSSWAKLPRWRKRLEGIKCYTVASITCLIWPEATDSAMYDSLRSQFIRTIKETKYNQPLDSDRESNGGLK